MKATVMLPNKIFVIRKIGMWILLRYIVIWIKSEVYGSLIARFGIVKG